MADSNARRMDKDGGIRRLSPTTPPLLALQRRLFSIPRVAGSLIDRDAMRLPDEVADRPLIMLNAPFGYGKTTIGVRIAATSEMPVAWLTMASAIDEPRSFGAHLWAALDGAISGAGCSFPVAPPSIDDSAGGALADALLEAGSPVRLIIDESHRISDPGTLRILTDLVLHAPPGLQVILLGRSAPPLPLSTFRLKGLLAEFGAADLAVSPSEAVALAAALGSDLDPGMVETMRQQTGGWIGGMRMALENPAALRDAGHAGVPGLDTMAADVLAEFDPAHHRFVAGLSFLDDLDSNAVEAIAGPDIDAAVARSHIATLAHLGYLQDETTGSVRRRSLHPVVREALGNWFADAGRSADQQGIHQRAARWFEREGQTTDAVRHALAAGLPAEACDIIERALSELLNREDWRDVDVILQMVPAEMRHQRPRLLVAAAWVSHLSGRFEPILEMEQQALNSLALGSLQPLDQQEITAEFTLLKHANSLLVESNPEGALHDIRNARRLIPPGQRLARGLGFLLEGWALASSGRIEESISVMGTEIVRQSETIDACSIRPMIGLLFGYRVGGNIGACERTAEDVVALAGAHDLPVSRGWGLWLSGMMAYEQDNLALAEARLSAIEEIGDIAHLLALREAMFCLAMCRLAAGRPEEALSTVSRLRDFVLDRHSAGIMPGIRSFEARLAHQLGDLESVRAWLASSQPTPPNTHLLAFEHGALTRAKALIATEGAAGVPEARRLLESIRARAERASSRSIRIEVLAISSIVNLAAGQQAAALADLAASLDLAGSDRYRRTYLELGPDIIPLLSRLDPARYPQAPDLLQRLTREKPAAAPAVTAPRPSPDRESILSVLTIREAEVLERLTRRLTNAEIAEELSISLQTVKSHAANIYGKLGVNSRREAIIAAESYDMGSVEQHRPRPGQSR